MLLDGEQLTNCLPVHMIDLNPALDLIGWQSLKARAAVLYAPFEDILDIVVITASPNYSQSVIGKLWRESSREPITVLSRDRLSEFPKYGIHLFR